MQELHNLALELQKDDSDDELDDRPQRSRKSEFARAVALFDNSFSAYIQLKPPGILPYHPGFLDVVFVGFTAFSMLWGAAGHPEGAALVPLLRNLSPHMLKWSAVAHPARRRLARGHQRDIQSDVINVSQVYLAILESDAENTKAFLHAHPDLLAQVLEMWVNFTQYAALPGKTDDIGGRAAYVIATAACHLYEILADEKKSPSEDDLALFLDALRDARITKRFLWNAIGPQTRTLCDLYLDPVIALSTWKNHIEWLTGLIQLPDFAPSRIPREVVASAVAAADFCLDKRENLAACIVLRYIAIICEVARDNRPLVQAIEEGVFDIIYDLDSVSERVDATRLVMCLCKGLVHARVLRAFRKKLDFMPPSEVDKPKENTRTWRTVMLTYMVHQNLYNDHSKRRSWRFSMACSNSSGEGPHTEHVRLCACGEAFYCSGSCQRMAWDRVHRYECCAADGPWGLQGAISIVDVAFFYCVVRAHIMSVKTTIGGWIRNYFEQCKKEPRPLEGLTIICDYAQVMPNPHHSVIARALDMKRHVNDHHIIRGHVSAEAIFYIGRTKVQRKMPFSYPMSYFCPSL
ncbi:hypothetical protein GGG16DRAFT_58111 [Schizophyllum commune]